MDADDRDDMLSCVHAYVRRSCVTVRQSACVVVVVVVVVISSIASSSSSAVSAPFRWSWHARSAERYAVPVENRQAVPVNLCGKLLNRPNCVRMGCSNIGQNLPVTLHCSPEFSARLCADFSFWNCFFGFFSVLAPPPKRPPNRGGFTRFKHLTRLRTGVALARQATGSWLLAPCFTWDPTQPGSKKLAGIQLGSTHKPQDPTQSV